MCGRDGVGSGGELGAVYCSINAGPLIFSARLCVHEGPLRLCQA